VTRNFVPSTGTGKKRGTATQTAPNQTAGPLCLSAVPLDIRTWEKKSLSITQKSESKLKGNKILVFAEPSGQIHHDTTALFHLSGLAKTKPAVRNKEKLIFFS
jgi:hypothetical protein